MRYFFLGKSLGSRVTLHQKANCKTKTGIEHLLVGSYLNVDILQIYLYACGFHWNTNKKYREGQKAYRFTMVWRISALKACGGLTVQTPSQGPYELGCCLAREQKGLAKLADAILFQRYFFMFTPLRRKQSRNQPRHVPNL